MASPSKIENRLGRMLQQFDLGMFKDYNMKTKKTISTYREDISKYMHVDAQDDVLVTGETNTSFTIDFAFPVYLTLSNPISKFRKIIVRKGSKYSWQVTLIPVYFASINNMSMLKLYQDKASVMFDPTSQYFDEKKCIRLSNKAGPEERNPARYSSMNIIEQLRAKDEDSSVQLSDIFQRYFEFGYWNAPGPGFTPGTHIHDDSNKWNAIFKIAKSIYLVEKIGKRENIPVLDFNVDITNVVVRPVNPKTLDFQSRSMPAKIATSAIEKIPDNANVINGIMTEVKLGGDEKCRCCGKPLKKHSPREMRECENFNGNHIEIMNDAFHYQPTRKNMTKLAMGIICENIFSDSLRTDMRTFKISVEILLDNWQTYVKTNDVEAEKFTEILDEMFPVIISNGSDVYFVHPLVWGFMERWSLLRSTSSLKETLLKLMDLLHEYTSLPFESKRKINYSEPMRAFQKIVPMAQSETPAQYAERKAKIPSSIIKLSKEIEFCKMMKQCRMMSSEELVQNSM